VNAELLLKVADLIEQTDRFDLNHFFCKKTGEDENGGLLTDCGTTGCVAGWVNATIGVPFNDDLDYGNTERAAEALGIDEDLADDRLFYACRGSIWAEVMDEFGWEDDGNGRVDDWSGITSSQAAEVLRRLADGRLTL
jgi:hypothetical protein